MSDVDVVRRWEDGGKSIVLCRGTSMNTGRGEAVLCVETDPRDLLPVEWKKVRPWTAETEAAMIEEIERWWEGTYVSGAP